MDTRTKLILAAEMLFGAHGLDGVPLRAVVEAAGQRNASALQYHIGGRDELVAAVLDFRRATVNAERVALLRRLEEAGPVGAPEIAVAILSPLVSLMRSEPQGGHYLRFLSQLFISDRPPPYELRRGRMNQGLRRCLSLYRALRPELPPRLVRERFALSGRHCVYALADWHRDQGGRHTTFQSSSLDEFEAGLIALTAALLMAPARLPPIETSAPTEMV